ncbi:MAG: DNA polymerase III subunit beta [Rickettsiaceae bacterium]|nr:DNA polymerase III subunit beta [Rickettsiaceae bacterium]
MSCAAIIYKYQGEDARELYSRDEQNTNDFRARVLTKEINKALNFASGIAEKKSFKPILSNVKIEAFESKMTFTATSNDMSIKIEFAGEIDKEGSTTVNMITLHDIIRKITDDTITLRFKEADSSLIIEGNLFNSNLSTLPAREFPSLDNNIEGEGELKISINSLLRLITCSEFAISTEDTRYNLCGIYLHSGNQKNIYAAALDGHRLSAICEKLDSNSMMGKNFGIIIPKKTIFELLKILKDKMAQDDDVIIRFDENRISFSVDNVILYSKLIDASFPAYQPFIPEKSDKELVISAKLLLDSIDRVSAITLDKFRAIKISLSESSITFSAFGEARGSANEEIKNSSDNKRFSYSGEPINIGLNPFYLIDILKNLVGQDVLLYINKELDPILVKSREFPDDSYIIMPLRV